MLDLSKIFLKFISMILGLSTSQNFPPPLSPERERELFKKMKEGDKSARAVIIEHNLRLVSHIIRKYYASYGDSDELLSVGSLGIIKAVDSFKSELGTRFATYGAKCVQNEILMYFRAQKKTGCEVSINRSKKKCSSEVSINETIDIDKDGNQLTYMDIICTEETMTENIDLEDNIKVIRELVNSLLTEREKEIVVLRYGLNGFMPKTQREVAKHLSISRSYVSRIEKKALEKLKSGFGDNIPIFDN